MESKLGGSWPAPPPWPAFPQGHRSPLQGTEVPQVCSQVPDPSQCTMNSHRDRERKNSGTRTQVSSTDNAATGVSGAKQDGSDPSKVTLSGLSSVQLCRGLESPLLCPRLCCGPGHSSPSGSEGILQAVASKLSASESAGSSWCSRVTAEPGEGTGAPPGAPEEPSPAESLTNTHKLKCSLHSQLAPGKVHALGRQLCPPA